MKRTTTTATTTTTTTTTKRLRSSSISTSIVVLKYSDLIQHKNLSAEIEKAFGKDGLGILSVSGIPDIAAKRQALLPLAPLFANMPSATKAKYEHPESFWSFGWSHGKEKLQGRPDFAKGSYYNNPCYNAPFGNDVSAPAIKEYMSFAHPNIWPTDDLPQLEHAFMDLGKTMCSVGQLVAQQCDTFVSSKSSKYETGKLARVLGESKVTKARLLHYFPKEEEKKARANSIGSDPGSSNNSSSNSNSNSSSSSTSTQPEFRGRSGSFSGKSTNAAVDAVLAANAKTAQEPTDDEFSNWCGWHNDHGSLTALCPAMYFQHQDNGSVVQLEKSPDPTAGLYIRARDGSLHHVKAPSTSHLLFQIGETSQIHSGGILQATPHAVKGVSVPNVCRSTFACFMEPGWAERMDAPADRTPEVAQSSTAELALPKGVSPLKARWGSKQCPFTTCNFGAFTSATLGALH